MAGLVTHLKNVFLVKLVPQTSRASWTNPLTGLVLEMLTTDAEHPAVSAVTPGRYVHIARP